MTYRLVTIGLIGLLASLPLFGAETLIVSNYPEEITEPGTLYSGPMPSDQTRILYYHVNRSSQNYTIHTVVENRSDKPVTVRTIKGVGGPSVDGIYSGHRSTLQFWDNLTNDHWTPIIIAPHQRQAILSQPFRPDMISTGLCELRTVTPAALRLIIGIADPDYESTSFINTPMTSYTCGVFTPISKPIQVTYNFELPVKEIPIGNEPFLQDPDSKIILRGNYGMTYDIDVKIENTASIPKEVNVLFAPTGGVARGILMINKKRVETGFIGLKTKFDPETIYTVTVPPRSTQALSIQTFPQAGCFYPVNIVLASRSENQSF